MSERNVIDIFAMDEDELKAFLEPLSAAEIESCMIELQNHVDDLNAKRGIVSAVYSNRLALEDSKKKLDAVMDGLTPEQRAALVQSIQVDSVVNKSQLGGVE